VTSRRLQTRRLRLRGAPPLEHNAHISAAKASARRIRRQIAAQRRLAIAYRKLYHTLGALSLGANQAAKAIGGFTDALSDQQSVRTRHVAVGVVHRGKFYFPAQPNF
jgi:hypothetical protein